MRSQRALLAARWRRRPIRAENLRVYHTSVQFGSNSATLRPEMKPNQQNQGSEKRSKKFPHKPSVYEVPIVDDGLPGEETTKFSADTMKLFYRLCEKRGLDPGTSFVQMLETLLPMIESRAPRQLGSSKTESQTLISLVGKSQYSQASGRTESSGIPEKPANARRGRGLAGRGCHERPLSGANPSLRDKLTQ
jgi:hypothetical protein